MELWVRTQDKKRLLKVDEFGIGECADSDKWFIYTASYGIGVYATEERCLEILNEIQKMMSGDPIGLLVAHDCELTEDFYDEVSKEFKDKGLACVYTPQMPNRNCDLQYIPKNFVAYEMPKE